MINTLKQKVTFRLDAELAGRLNALAGRERVPVSYVLRHMVIRLLAEPAKDGAARPFYSRSSMDAPEVLERKHREFREKCCTLFDEFRRQGYDAKEAAKRTNFALKAVSHPWASYEVVASTLRAAGRFRKGVRT